MRLRLALFLIIASVAVAIPSPSEACSCAGVAPIAMAYERADLVFVGTVRSAGPSFGSRVNSDNSVSVGVAASREIVFDVSRVLKGNAARQLTLTGSMTTCDVPFKDGETWLVYARVNEGKVTTDKCTRTQLREGAERAIAFIDGHLQGRPQGVVSGSVLRRIADGAGLRVGEPFERITIIAAGPAGRVELPLQRWGDYFVVLPPGDFDIWVEREGRVVSDRTPVRVTDRAQHTLMLMVENE